MVQPVLAKGVHYCLSFLMPLSVRIYHLFHIIDQTTHMILPQPAQSKLALAKIYCFSQMGRVTVNKGETRGDGGILCGDLPQSPQLQLQLSSS